MKKATNKMAHSGDDEMRPEYDFSNAARGKHHRAMQGGYTIVINNADGTKVVKEVMPKTNAVLLEPDVQEHFPDSESVNRALRCLIPLLDKHKPKSQHP